MTDATDHETSDSAGEQTAFWSMDDLLSGDESEVDKDAQEAEESPPPPPQYPATAYSTTASPAVVYQEAVSLPAESDNGSRHRTLTLSMAVFAAALVLVLVIVLVALAPKLKGSDQPSVERTVVSNHTTVIESPGTNEPGMVRQQDQQPQTPNDAQTPAPAPRTTMVPTPETTGTEQPPSTEQPEPTQTTNPVPTENAPESGVITIPGLPPITLGGEKQ